MEFWLTIVYLVRRRRVIISALLVAAVFGTVAFLATPVTYVSRTTMVLTLTQFGGSESRDPSTPTELTNPMLSFTDSLTTTSAILINAMNTKAVAHQLDAEGATHLVVDDGRSDPDLLGLNGPFLHVRVESNSRTEAGRVAEEAQVLLRRKLREWQEALDAPRATFIRLVDVVPPGAPEVDRSRQTKFGLLAVGLGAAMTIGTAYLRLRIRARRRPGTVPPDVKPDALPEDGPLISRIEEPVPVAQPYTSTSQVLVPDIRGPEGEAFDARSLEKARGRRTR